jgi:hypothetical protein
MTFPEKESVVVLERYAGQEQRRIYTDACDIGVVLNHNELARTEIRMALRGLLSFYKPKVWTGDNQKSWEFTIPIEHDEGGVQCMTVEILWAKDRRVKKEYVAIYFGSRMIMSESVKKCLK